MSIIQNDPDSSSEGYFILQSGNPLTDMSDIDLEEAGRKRMKQE